MATPSLDGVDARIKTAFESLWNDREIGAKVQERVKALYPDAKTNADVFDPVLAPVRDELATLTKQHKELLAQMDADRKAAEESKQRRTLESQLDAARKNFNLTDEGFDKMVARMKETGNFSDADAAAAWVASKAPPAAVKGPTWAPQALNLFGTQKADEAFAMLHRDPQGYMDAQLSEFVRDPDAYVNDTFRAN